MKRRIWMTTPGLILSLTMTGAMAGAVAGCGDPFTMEGDLARSYLGEMDEVILTPRGAEGGDASSSSSSEEPPEGGSIEDDSGNPVDAQLKLSVPSVQIDLEPAPETDNSAHLFVVRTQVIELRSAYIDEAVLDLRLIRRQIGITDILRYLHIDEKAVLADLRLQLQNQLREIFLRSFRLNLTQQTESEVMVHAPREASFECAFHKHGFDGSEFSGPPISCTAEIGFNAPIESLRITLRGP